MSQSGTIAVPSAAATAASARPAVEGAIARAARATGVDFGYLLAQARIESGLNPAARAGTSSAAGLYQFTKGTWLSTLEAHGARHGLPWADGAIDGGRVADPALRQRLLAMRHDPELSARMAAELAADNGAALKGVLGRDPDAAELYMAHFLGAEGAGRFLSALAADPAQSAAALLPQAAAANRPIFYGRDGAPRSVGGVMELMRGKMAGAMEASGLPSTATLADAEGGWQAPAWTQPPAWNPAPDAPATVPQAPRPSMAETLAATFGGGDAMPDRVRAAYGKLRAFGL